MNFPRTSSICAAVLLLFSISARASDEAFAALNPALEIYVEARIAEFDQIPDERREALDELAAYIRSEIDAGEPVHLLFIGAHNSQRSQLAQLWATAAAIWYDLPGVRTYSGGTEATAFNTRAVSASRRAGFEPVRTTDDDNPIYHVRYSPNLPPMTCFSKVYSSAPNPTKDFAAVMVCAQADEACPQVFGSAARISLAYVDPKVSDNTGAEARTYDERCAQIARELLYVMSRVTE